MLAKYTVDPVGLQKVVGSGHRESTSIPGVSQSESTSSAPDRVWGRTGGVPPTQAW